MSVMNHDQGPRSGGLGTFLLIGGAAVALIGAVFVVAMMWGRPAPEPKGARAQAHAGAAAPSVASNPVEPERETGTPAAAVRRRPRPEKPAAAPAAPAPAGPALVVESDVPGASVFVDRNYLGTTPLRTTQVAAGSHQLNASVTGEEGLAQPIDVAASGDTTITLRFKEVRLNASVAVVHKHAMGSCEGRLVATTDGLRYDTPNRKDAFIIPLNGLEVFEIDYLKKELKVKQRGGKAWNFTDRAENADKLFVFHRDVTKAREKLTVQSR